MDLSMTIQFFNYFLLFNFLIISSKFFFCFSENRWKKRGITMVPVSFGIAFTALFLNQVCLKLELCCGPLLIFEMVLLSTHNI